MADSKQAPEFIVRLASEAELPSLRKWLPQAFLSQPSPIFFVAEKTGPTPILIGGASLRLLGEGAEKVGRFLVYVVPEERRKGVGTALLGTLGERAIADKATSILAGRSFEEDDEEGGRFCQAMGLTPLRTIQRLRVPTRKSREVLARIRDRLTAKGKIPTDFQLVPLTDARPDFIARFVLSYLGGIPESVRMSLQSPDKGYHPEFSLVLRKIDGPKGVVLAKIHEGQLRVEARVVHPEMRGSWVNVVMLLAFIEKAISAGFEEVFFEADEERHADTLRLAEHGSGGAFGRQFLYGYVFPSK